MPPRKKRMPPGKPIKRKGKRRFKGEKFENKPYREWIASLPCCITGSSHRGDVVAAHVKGKGIGGPDYANTVPLCHRHHIEELHQHGPETFARTFGVDLAALALEYAALYEVRL